MDAVYRENLTYKRSVIQRAARSAGETLHVIIPHRVNWRLTEVCVEAYVRLTRRPLVVTVVNNFDSVPPPGALLETPHLGLIQHRWTLLGRLLGLGLKENGSINNALALDAALAIQPELPWGFASHNDSAPLVKHWDDFFFEGLSGGRIVGNFRDTIRVHAAHSSGTLFDQKTLVENQVSLVPVYEGGIQKWDVCDRATVELHKDATKPVPVLPNTINDPARTIEVLEANHPLLASLSKDGSAISLDPSASFPVFGHLGRGTPRSMKDPRFAAKMPQEVWIELVESIR